MERKIFFLFAASTIFFFSLSGNLTTDFDNQFARVLTQGLTPEKIKNQLNKNFDEFFAEIEERQTVMPPWVRFTLFEQKMLERIINAIFEKSSFEQFHCDYESKVEYQVKKLLQAFEPVLQKDLCSNININFKKSALRRLQDTLTKDIALAIDLAIEFQESQGVVNSKTEAAFNKWLNGTVRIFYALMKFDPSFNREKLASLLERRLREMNYFIQSLTLYKFQPNAKNANALNLHHKTSLEYSQEISNYLHQES